MALPESAVEAGVVVGATILFVFARYFRNVSKNPDISFSFTKSGKTLLLGLVGGGIAFTLGNGTSGDALSMAVVMAVPIVDSLWNQFASRWDYLDQNETAQEFEETADELVDNYGDEAADKMDEQRGELTGDSVAKSEPPSAESQNWPPSVTTADEQVNEKVDAVKNTRHGYQKLRAVAALISSVNGLGTRKEIENALREYEDPHAVLDAFATVEARERGERQAEHDP